MADKAPRNNAHCTIPDDAEQSTYRYHHRGRQARPAIAGRRASGPADVFQETHRHRHGRSAPRAGEIQPDRPGARRTGARTGSLVSIMKIILGVGGGIAAYKSAELARLLMQQGHQVQAVMTPPRRSSSAPSLSPPSPGARSLTDLFAIESAIEHISVAQENELLLIAPATADLIAKMAHGLAGRLPHHPLPGLHRPGGDRAGDEREYVAAPRHPGQPGDPAPPRAQHRRARQRIPGLRHDRPRPPGRAAGAIADAIKRACHAAAAIWKGETVLITAGPTQEPLDPVRYISNRSSGKMGYALAEAAAAARRARGPGFRARPSAAAARRRSCSGPHRGGDARQVFEHLGPAPASSSRPPPWPIFT